MKNIIGVGQFAAAMAVSILLTCSLATAEKTVVIPLFSATGDADTQHVMKNQTFSNKSRKGVVGELEVSPAMQSYTTPIYGMTFNFIPVGTFLMGSPIDEPGHGSSRVSGHGLVTQVLRLFVAGISDGRGSPVAFCTTRCAFT